MGSAAVLTKVTKISPKIKERNYKILENAIYQEYLDKEMEKFRFRLKIQKRKEAIRHGITILGILFVLLSVMYKTWF